MEDDPITETESEYEYVEHQPAKNYINEEEDKKNSASNFFTSFFKK